MNKIDHEKIVLDKHKERGTTNRPISSGFANESEKAKEKERPARGNQPINAEIASEGKWLERATGQTAVRATGYVNTSSKHFKTLLTQLANKPA